MLASQAGTGIGNVRTTLGSNDAALLERAKKELKIRLLEERLGRPLWVAAVGDDDVELALAVSQELEPVADVHVDIGMLEADAHAGQVFLADADDGLVDVAERRLFHRLVLDYLAENAAVAAADH